MLDYSKTRNRKALIDTFQSEKRTEKRTAFEFDFPRLPRQQRRRGRKRRKRKRNRKFGFSLVGVFVYPCYGADNENWYIPLISIHLITIYNYI